MLYENSHIKTILIFSLFIWSFWGFQPKEKSDTNDISFHQDTVQANQLIKKADSLLFIGQFQKAVDVLEQSKNIFQGHSQWESIISCSVQQARIADNLVTNTKQSYANEALKLAKKHLHKYHYQLGKAYQQVAEVQIINEQYDSSITFFKKAIQIFEQQKKWNDCAWVIISKSVNYYYLEDYKAFEDDLIQAQKLYKKHQLDDEIYITTLDLLALVYNTEGDFFKAIENTKSSLQFYLNKPYLTLGDSITIATNYSNIGQFYSEIGAFNKADNYFLKAIKFSKDVELSNYVNALYSISNNAIKTENYSKCIDYAHRCLKLVNGLDKKEQKIYVIANSNIGNSYNYLQQFDSSEYYLKKAINYGNNEYLLFSKLDFTTLLLEQYQSNKALTILKDINPLELSKEHQKAYFYRNLARAYGQNKDFEKSMFYFQKTINCRIPSFTDTLDFYSQPDLQIRIKDPLFFLKDLKLKAYHLSQFSDKQQNLEAALETYDLAFQWIDTLLQSYSYDDSRTINNKRNRKIYEQAINVASQLYQRTNDKKYITKAFNYAEKIKSNILLSDLQADDNQTIIPKPIQDREKELAANVSFYERQLQLAKNNEEKEKINLYQNYLTDYRIALGELKDSLKDNYSKYYELKYTPTLATIPTIQADLETNQSFVSYYSGDSSTYIFTISKSDFHFSKLNSTSTIDEKVIAFRQMLNQPNSTIEGFTNYNQTATDLYSTVLQQSIEQLPKSVNQLIIIPDGTLNYIPFEILTSEVVKTPSQDFSKLPYLLYDYQIQYGYSATLLRENEKRQNQLKTNSKCLAYAPPYESNEPMAQRRGTMQTLRDGTIQLQGTGKEIQAIATYFKGDFDQSETATKAKFIKQAPDFGILHLAMHGEANYENENLANLKFTNTQGQSEEDYLLYQSEIANMDLNAQLVVLSACETGLGKYLYGEGIASLGRSFMYAGVPSIVMSLWKVDDKATSQLMPYFYENLSEEMPKNEALHQAKLTFLKKEDLSKIHPHYWAGFVSIGDVQPIKNGRNWGIWLILGSSLLLLGSGFLIWRKFLNIKNK